MDCKECDACEKDGMPFYYKPMLVYKQKNEYVEMVFSTAKELDYMPGFWDEFENEDDFKAHIAERLFVLNWCNKWGTWTIDERCMKDKLTQPTYFRQ
ncbi:hypothetical protein [Laceyella putida]|uniref:Uncharacterized protein n=1 Tax=Laceyella putida TaxID=110101 RepID=A0ABW2RP43_9BACL